MISIRTISQISMKTDFNYDYFSSLESSWDRIKKSPLPVVVYGMGDGCLKILDRFRYYGIECKGIFASDDFVRGHEFQGFRVKRYCDICEEFDDFIVVPAFGTSLPEIMQRFEKIAQEHTFIMPDTSVFGDEYFEKSEFLARFEQAQRVYELLCDEQSGKVYKNVIAFKVTGDISYLREVFTQPSEAYENILKLNDNESYVDLGAYTGDTIAEFLHHTKGKYEQIIALEPNVKNFRKCMKNTIHLDNIEWYNAAAWSSDEVRMFSKNAGRQATITDSGVPVQCLSVDTVVADKGCTYLKYDVEGADKNAIEGSVRTIRQYSPKICTALYHRAYDIIDIPLMLHEIEPNYSMYMRQYPYYPSWETNLFAVCRQ